MADPRKAQEHSPDAREKLIVALDVDSADSAKAVVADLEGIVDTFKVGLQLFCAAGGTFVRELVEGGSRIFLDLKFHDIPTTVSRAGIEAAKLGVWMFNVHASGGGEMMKRTADDVGEFCFKSNLPLPRIIGVTVLTSSDERTLRETGAGKSVSEQVVRLAKLSAGSGMLGVVASGKEVEVIRNAITDPDFLIVTPGVRPLSATNDDQKRVITPGEAILKGSSYLVVGRPIAAALDPRSEAQRIIDEMNGAARNVQS
jgi:orotidine-5'-phosphate decarboxylase